MSQLAKETLVLNMGPQHPATHGVLRLILELEGEVILGVEPVIGYLHTGFEKEMETRTYHQNIVFPPRIEYLATFIRSRPTSWPSKNCSASRRPSAPKSSGSSWRNSRASPAISSIWARRRSTSTSPAC